MSRFTTPFRAGVVALGVAALLAGCAGPAPAPVETKPAEPDFGTIGGESPVPIETGVPVEPTEPDSSGFVTVYDDLQVVAVSVPEEWSDVDGEGFTSDGGQDWAFVAAAEDLDGYLERWDVAGVEVGATSVTGVDQATLDEQLLALLTSISSGYSTCGTVTAEAQPYSDPYFTGYESLWEDCGGDTVGFAITVTNADLTQVMFVRGQITGAYDAEEVYTQIVNTFDTSIGRSQARG